MGIVLCVLAAIPIFLAAAFEGDHIRVVGAVCVTLATIYWSLAVAGYLAFSFIIGRWDRSWIIWPVAGVLYGSIIGITRLIGRKG